MNTKVLIIVASLISSAANAKNILPPDVVECREVGVLGGLVYLQAMKQGGNADLDKLELASNINSKERKVLIYNVKKALREYIPDEKSPVESIGVIMSAGIMFDCIMDKWGYLDWQDVE